MENNHSIQLLPPNSKITIYQYEIYVFGGILITSNLGHDYQCSTEDEVCFECVLLEA